MAEQRYHTVLAMTSDGETVRGVTAIAARVSPQCVVGESSSGPLYRDRQRNSEPWNTIESTEPSKGATVAKITVLGNCATQTPERDTTGFLVEQGDFRVLIDCGPAVVRQLQRIEVRASDIDLLIITHAHADHCAAYPYFMFTAYAERLMGVPGKGPVPVIALPEVHRGIESMFRFQYPPGHYDEVPTRRLNAASAGVSSFTFNDISVRTVPVQHAVPNIGIRIDFNGGASVALSGDTEYCPSFVALARDVDALYHEAFCAQDMARLAAMTKHSTARDAGRAANATGAKHLSLTHLLAPAWGNPEALLAEAAQEYAGPIDVPSDLSSRMIG